MRYRLTATVLVAALALVSAGCGGDDDPDPPNDPPAATGSPGAPASPGGPDDPDDPDDSERAPIAFNEDGATGSFDCGGQDVTINGDDSELELTGECAVVVINGSRAEVTIEDAEIIVVNGVDSHVTYSGDPEVHVNGEGATADEAG